MIEQNTCALKRLLDIKVEQYNTLSFIENDPIVVPHLFKNKQDIEIAGFFAALIAWGNRKIIVRNAQRLVALMEFAPFDFVMHASAGELKAVDSFVHRTINSKDIINFVLALRQVYLEKDGLEFLFSSTVLPTDENVLNGLIAYYDYMSQLPFFPQDRKKHLPNVLKGAAAKRLNMFLRWMVRKDNKGVDFGLWNTIKPSQLIMPLDIHTGNMGRKLGLINKKQNDITSALLLTQKLKEFCETDPVKYDFALFGMGIFES